MNSGVWAKGSCYNEYERDYYVVLLNIYVLEYFGIENNIVVFKYHWFDTERGIRMHSHHGLVEVNHKSWLASNELFVLAEQAQQVYYSCYPCIGLNR